MLERQAVAEGSAIQQQLGRDAALLRAEEEDANRRFALDAANRAAELGLGEAAFRFDLANADLQSATNLLNNQFQQLGIDKQLTEAESQRLLNYARDMAAIELQYAGLNQAEKLAVMQDLTSRYGIDKQYEAALQELNSRPSYWQNLLTTVVGGGLQGGGAALGGFLSRG